MKSEDWASPYQDHRVLEAFRIAGISRIAGMPPRAWEQPAGTSAVAGTQFAGISTYEKVQWEDVAYATPFVRAGEDVAANSWRRNLSIAARHIRVQPVSVHELPNVISTCFEPWPRRRACLSLNQLILLASELLERGCGRVLCASDEQGKPLAAAITMHSHEIENIRFSSTLPCGRPLRAGHALIEGVIDSTSCDIVDLSGCSAFGSAAMDGISRFKLARTRAIALFSSVKYC